MIFTDCQMWDSTGDWNDNSEMSSLWQQYKKINSNAQLFLFDLAGYGDTPLDIRSNDVYLIAGWSDKIFDVLASLEEGKHLLDMLTK